MTLCSSTHDFWPLDMMDVWGDGGSPRNNLHSPEMSVLALLRRLVSDEQPHSQATESEVCSDGACALQSCLRQLICFSCSRVWDTLPFPGLAPSVTDIRRSHSFLRYLTLLALNSPSPPDSSSSSSSYLTVLSSHLRSHCLPARLPLSRCAFLKSAPVARPCAWRVLPPLARGRRG